MTLEYVSAVDFIEHFLREVAKPLWTDPRFPYIEQRMEQALMTLKLQEEYNGGAKQH